RPSRVQLVEEQTSGHAPIGMKVAGPLVESLLSFGPSDGCAFLGLAPYISRTPTSTAGTLITGVGKPWRLHGRRAPRDCDRDRFMSVVDTIRAALEEAPPSEVRFAYVVGSAARTDESMSVE